MIDSPALVARQFVEMTTAELRRSNGQKTELCGKRDGLNSIANIQPFTCVTDMLVHCSG